MLCSIILKLIFWFFKKKYVFKRKFSQKILLNIFSKGLTILIFHKNLTIFWFIVSDFQDFAFTVWLELLALKSYFGHVLLLRVVALSGTTVLWKIADIHIVCTLALLQFLLESRTQTSNNFWRSSLHYGRNETHKHTFQLKNLLDTIHPEFYQNINSLFWFWEFFKCCFSFSNYYLV